MIQVQVQPPLRQLCYATSTQILPHKLGRSSFH